MFLNDSYFPALTFIQNNCCFNFFLQAVLAALFIFIFCSKSIPIQLGWVNNPAENTNLAADVSDPINISSVSDQNGGIFLFWQDNKSSFQNEIYFNHISSSGKISLTSSGIQISGLSGEKHNPISIASQTNEAVVVWKDFTRNNSGDLFAQKVSDNGNLLWTNEGLQITKSSENKTEYSAASDKNGNIFISFLTQNPDLNQYKIMIQKISGNGILHYKNEGKIVYKSNTGKIMPYLIADEKGGAFIFWLESQNNKSILSTQHIDSSGNLKWGKKPITFSNSSHNVISYSANKSSSSLIYLAWQVQKEKEIYHQLINSKGKMIWNAGGKISSPQKGNKSNPQIIVSDLSYILCWTNELQGDKNIFIQKFKENGKPVWNGDGVPVIKLRGDQFGQKIVSDEKGGAIVTWIDRRSELLWGNIYAQRINSDGTSDWDSLALPVGLNYNSEKSYVSIVPDNESGAVVIFKEKRNKKNGIFGQKIFNTGTYISQILGFNTELAGDSIKISWYCANESAETSYDIERTAQSDTANTNWSVITSFYSEDKSSARYYEYIEKPEVTGTLYYRIVQKYADGEQQHSEISKVNYFEASPNVIVVQNIPNPFSDSTVISFYLPRSSPVKVEFFNSRLEKINEINEKDYPPGENEITFFSQGFQAGIYFFRIKVKDFVEVKKMVLTR